MAAETLTDTTATEAAPAAADLDAKAWESITGEKPESPEIEAPNFAKLEADGKLEGEGKPRGPDGKFAPKAKPEEANEPEDEAKEPKGEKPKPEAKKPEAKPAKTDKKDDKPPDRDTRRKILAAKEIVGRVLKYNDDDVDAMPPEKLLDLAQRVKGTYEAFERLKEDHRALKEKARGPRDGQKPVRAEQAPDDGRGRSANPDDDAESLPAEREEGGSDQLLRDYLDPDTYKQVQRTQHAERARFKNQVTEATERAQSAESRLILDRIEVARERVAEKFPQLNDNDRFDAVLKLMDDLDPQSTRSKGDLGSFVKFMERVAASEFHEEVERTTRDRLITGNRKDRSSQPETTSHGSQPTAMTWDEFESYAAWASQEAGGNKAKMDNLMAKVKRPPRPS